MGIVEMNTPAIGMKEQINTNNDSSPSPGMDSAQIPIAVKSVLAPAIRA
jgi:hypothetical protein